MRTRKSVVVAVALLAVLQTTAACGTPAAPPSDGQQPGAQRPGAQQPGAQQPDAPQPDAPQPDTSASVAAVVPSASGSPSGTPRPSRRPTSPGGPAGGAAPGLTSARLTTGSTAVALTFDDGPDPVNTPKLLDLLKASRVKATFCLVGERVRSYPRVVARIAAEGHTLCNHSWQHLETLYRRDDRYIRRDLQRTTDAIRKAVPGARVDYFRAPYGNFTPRLSAIARALGMTALGWDVDDQCYQTAVYGTGKVMVARMVRRVERQVRPGSIVLGHDLSKPHTITAYRTILPWLTGRFTVTAMPPVGRPPRGSS